MTSWPSWLRRKTVNLEIVSSILTEVVFLGPMTLPHLPLEVISVPVILKMTFI